MIGSLPPQVKGRAKPLCDSSLPPGTRGFSVTAQLMHWSQSVRARVTIRAADSVASRVSAETCAPSFSVTTGRGSSGEASTVPRTTGTSASSTSCTSSSSRPSSSDAEGGICALRRATWTRPCSASTMHWRASFLAASSAKIASSSASSVRASSTSSSRNLALASLRSASTLRTCAKASALERFVFLLESLASSRTRFFALKAKLASEAFSLRISQSRWASTNCRDNTRLLWCVFSCSSCFSRFSASSSCRRSVSESAFAREWRSFNSSSFCTSASTLPSRVSRE
mmetsp:Transcript_12403/g.25208  ORF Transcript_12403/g.25208 Transcript_12403/m.25208 type:complete len:285 (-) Transcript_12403:299-1153(-)